MTIFSKGIGETRMLILLESPPPSPLVHASGFVNGKMVEGPHNGCQQNSRSIASTRISDLDRFKLEKKRERNRIAASKCRQRKLERISDLGKNRGGGYLHHPISMKPSTEQLSPNQGDMMSTYLPSRKSSCMS